MVAVLDLAGVGCSSAAGGERVPLVFLSNPTTLEVEVKVGLWLSLGSDNKFVLKLHLGHFHFFFLKIIQFSQ